MKHSSQNNGPSYTSDAGSVWAPVVGGNAGYATGNNDVHITLGPLIERLREYGLLLSSLRKDGGHISKLSLIRSLLRHPVKIIGRTRVWDVVLADPKSIADAVADATGFRVFLQIRQTAGGWPAYLLCRTRRDYWSQYSLVVEEYHRSPHYPAVDQRFVKLMTQGREHNFLSMSPFRIGVHALLENREGTDLDLLTDDLLFQIGTHILQAAWHEDQRVGIVTAKHL